MVSPRILIVEDNVLIADDVARFLRSYGYAVAGEAPSIESGLRMVQAGRIDGALVDVDLFGQPSIPVCQALQTKGVPFAFLTGYGRHPVLSQFSQAPYIAKPPSAPHVLAALNTVLPPGLAELGNAMLDRLDPWRKARLRVVLERVRLPEGESLGTPEVPRNHAYFPIDALIALRYGRTGRRVEVAHVGNRGALALTALFGSAVEDFQASTLIGGEAWRVSHANLERIIEHDPVMRRYFSDSVAALLHQSMETAMLNARASVMQRVAHWLLRVSQEAGTLRLSITHDVLADCLGVRRASVTVALHELEGLGVLRSKRGYALILDRPRLHDLI